MFPNPAPDWQIAKYSRYVKRRVEVLRAKQYNRGESTPIPLCRTHLLLNSFATPRRQQPNPTGVTRPQMIPPCRVVSLFARFRRPTAGLALPASLFGATQVATSARVVVVGAGLAGLTCAYRLKRSGIIATVYEANTRLGGRCWTRRGDFAQGQIAEHGGELIDQGHTTIRHLAQELGLPLDNLLAAEPNGSTIFASTSMAWPIPIAMPFVI